MWGSMLLLVVFAGGSEGAVAVAVAVQIEEDIREERVMGIDEEEEEAVELLGA